MSSISFPGESPEYRIARDQLLEQEAELRRLTETVATARRALPPGGIIPQDYIFQEPGKNNTPGEVRMSELFTPGKNTLVIYTFMFPRSLNDEQACPHCTAMLDALDGAFQHVTQRINFVVVAKAPLTDILAHAQTRNWRWLRLLSSAHNTYNRDYFGEDANGAQWPMLNVFQRQNTIIRHFWGSELAFAPTEPGQDPRHVDLIDPQWNLFDFTPEGRGSNWYPALNYHCHACKQ